jgi:SAM-dependent methyltransferase
MRESLRVETEKLQRSWMQHDPAWLRDYLVSSVEDPRTNLQSIFSRHFLIRSTLWKRQCSVPTQTLELLMEHECRFSAVMGWLVPAISGMRTNDEVTDLLYAFERGIQNTETAGIPGFVLRTFKMLPASVGEFEIPNYIRRSLEELKLEGDSVVIPEHTMNRFIELWRKLSTKFDALDCGEPGKRPEPHGAAANPQLALSVLEPACGSANDYRFMQAAGLASLFDYTGIDLCEKNIENARGLFPGVDFRAGNVFEIEAPDRAFDVCFFHDLLEHLSVEGLEAAVKEMCRATRYSICAGFFQMHEMDEHIFRKVEDYHLNTLSVSRTCELFEANGFFATVVPVARFLRDRFGCEFTHNPNAWTLVLTRAGGR